MKPSTVVLGLAVLSAIMTRGAHADGSLPPQPYNYLHPPPSLAAENVRPASANRSYSAAYARSRAWFLFTRDGQAGVAVRQGALVVPPPATSLRVRLEPVDVPPGLPRNATVQGNAYHITARVEPGDGAIQLARPVQITLRWPLAPDAVYVHQGGAWREVCNSAHATLTSSTITCATTTLGTFVAISTPSPLLSVPTWLIYLAELLGLGLIALVIYLFTAVRDRRADRLSVLIPDHAQPRRQYQAAAPVLSRRWEVATTDR